MKKKYSVVITALDIVTVNAESKEKAEELARIAVMCNPGGLSVTYDAEEIPAPVKAETPLYAFVDAVQGGKGGD